MGKKNAIGAIKKSQLKQYDKEFRGDTSNIIAMNAVTRGDLNEIALNRDILRKVDFNFSHEVEGGNITDQTRSNTCWLFAELNWLRVQTMRKLNMESIEFSQNYVMFYDKLEKANFFYENIIEMADRETDDRELHHLLNDPTPDGGEWHMIVNLVEKYGLVPKTVMADTFNRENSKNINSVVAYKLREGAVKLRKKFKEGNSREELRLFKETLMAEMYRMLCIFFGTPPQSFSWSFRDKDKKFHREESITPQAFYKKYVGVDFNKIFCLMSCPSRKTEFGKTYTVRLFNNMVGGQKWIWLNVPITEIKKACIKMLKDNEPVLFGCDVVQSSHSKLGLLYNDLFHYDLLFQTGLELDKRERVDYLQTRLTHSMVFTGVDLVDDKPVKWKVENSWGEKVGKKGYFMMSDEWFDEHMFDLIIHKKYLSDKLIKQFKQTPIELPPWFPMA